MDYKLLILSTSIAVGGLYFALTSLRKGIKGYQSTRATRPQRWTDFAGTFVFSGAGLLFLALGIIGVVVTIKMAKNPPRPMTNMSEMVGVKPTK